MTQNQTLSIFKQKEKEKQIETGRGPAKRPSGRPTYAQPTRAPRALPPLCAVTDERVQLVRLRLLCSLRDADRETLPVSSVSTAHGGLATTPAAASVVPGSRARAHRLRLAFVTSLMPFTHALLSPFYLGHANGGRPP